MNLSEVLKQYKWLGFVIVFILGWALGISRGLQHTDVEIDKLKQQQALAAQKAAVDYVQKLEEAQQEMHAWQQKATELNQIIIAQKAQTQARAQKNKKGINHAIEQDENNSGSCINGLGTHSLQQYKHALGYDD